MSWQWGLWASRILQIPLFRNPKGRRLLRFPQFGPQNQTTGVLKSLGTPFRACLQGVLVVPLLASILRG